MTIVKKFRSPADAALTDHLADKGRRTASAGKSLHHAVRLGAGAAPRNDLLPELKLRLRPLTELTMSGRKFRLSVPAHVAEVATSIRLFGVCAPVIVSGAESIDGQVRAEAARWRPRQQRRARPPWAAPLERVELCGGQHDGLRSAGAFGRSSHA